MSDYPKIVNAQGVEVVDTSDAAWATYVAEGRAQLAKAEAELAETRHQLEMAKAEGLHALNSVKYDPEVLEGARALHAQNPAGPSVDELIEAQIIPIRAKYLSDFDASIPAGAPTKVGAGEAAFLRLMGQQTNG